MKKMPAGIRKHIRFEKARIRREVFDIKQQEKMIAELIKKFAKKDEGSRNLQPSLK